MRAAATFLRAHAERFPVGAIPQNPTQLAALAVQVHGAFVAREGEEDAALVPSPDFEVVRAAVGEARRR